MGDDTTDPDSLLNPKVLQNRLSERGYDGAMIGTLWFRNINNNGYNDSNVSDIHHWLYCTPGYLATN